MQPWHVRKRKTYKVIALSNDRRNPISNNYKSVILMTVIKENANANFY